MEVGRDGGEDGNRKALLLKDEEGEDGGSHIWIVGISTLVAVLGSYLFGSAVAYSSPTELGIMNDLDLTLAQYSVFGSMLSIGAMIGAATSGLIADFIGRKGAMRMSSVSCTVGWLFIYLCKGALSLDVGRFCTGYGIGILSYVVPVFIAEITPKNLRGGFTTVNQLMVCIGGSVTLIVGTIISWRTLALTGLVPCFVLLLGLFFIPESPRWLAKVGHQKEFEDALHRLRGKGADVSMEAAEIQDYVETLQNLPKAKIQDLFQRRYARSVIVGIGLMVFQQFGGINGIATYMSVIFVSAGFSSGSIGTITVACVQVFNSLPWPWIFEISSSELMCMVEFLQIPVTALGAMLTDKTGRRPLLMISSAGTCLGCLLTGISFHLKGHNMLSGWAPVLALTGIMVYFASFAIGMGAIPWVIMSEIFPMNVKGIAGSLVTLVNWLVAWVVSYTFNFLMSWSSSGTFFLYAGASAVTVLFVVKLVPETKGRTLEEIQISMNSY